MSAVSKLGADAGLHREMQIRKSVAEVNVLLQHVEVRPNFRLARAAAVRKQPDDFPLAPAEMDLVARRKLRELGGQPHADDHFGLSGREESAADGLYPAVNQKRDRIHSAQIGKAAEPQRAVGCGVERCDNFRRSQRLAGTVALKLGTRPDNFVLVAGDVARRFRGDAAAEHDPVVDVAGTEHCAAQPGDETEQDEEDHYH